MLFLSIILVPCSKRFQFASVDIHSFLSSLKFNFSTFVIATLPHCIIAWLIHIQSELYRIVTLQYYNQFEISRFNSSCYLYYSIDL